jgi:hypothetical protein
MPVEDEKPILYNSWFIKIKPFGFFFYFKNIFESISFFIFFALFKKCFFIFIFIISNEYTTAINKYPFTLRKNCF